MSINICVINKSSMVSNADVQTMVAAIQVQLTQHLLPAWNMSAGSIQFCADATQVPAKAWVIYIIDNDAQVSGALGYHEETNDQVVGYIMCQPILSNGGVILAFDPSNPGQYSVSGTLSHEVCEAIGDPYTSCWYDNGNASWCGELCDPVEQVGYGIMVNGVNCAVSDFVCPQFFNQEAQSSDAPFNYLRTLSAPFTMLQGGYSIQRTAGPGSEQQVFGQSMPQWRQEMKKAEFSRGGRILKNAKTSCWQKVLNWLKTL